jgi:hypothetical protein
MAKAGFPHIVCNHRAEAAVQNFDFLIIFLIIMQFFVFISCFAPCFSLAINQFQFFAGFSI